MGGYELGDYENRLIAAIYEAALDSTKWRVVLAEICQFIDADEASLLFYDQQHSQRNFTITAHNTNSDNSFTKHLEREAQKIKTLFSNLLPGQIVTSTSLSSQPNISCNSNLGNAHQINEANDYELRLGIPLAVGDIIFATLCFHCLRSASDLSAKAVEFVAQLSPHFVRAIHIYNHLSVLRAENDSLLEAIKRTNLAVFLLDASLRVVFASPEAQRLLANHPALRLNRNMRLQAHIAKEQLRLEAILTEFLDEGFRARYVTTEGISLPLLHPAKAHPLKLCFLPIQHQQAGLPDNLPCLAVFANDPELHRYISPQYLQQAYGLTVTETQLAQLLLKGLGIADISNERGTSQETTRWQMKQIMHKTQTHSQIELTRLLTLLTNEFTNEKPHLPTNNDGSR
jgi:DNA-binding CsgD family transcriptional regulator/GAF domain-containing protein